MNPRPILLRCLSIILVVTVAGTAAADEDVPERQTSSIADAEGHFYYVSSSIDFEQNDRFNMEFDNGNLEVSYEADLTTATSQDWSYDIEFQELIAFKDNGNGYLDSSDEVTHTVDLEDASYSLQWSAEDTSAGFEKGYVIATCEEGLLTLEFVTTPTLSTVGSMQLLPTEVKLNISIAGMSYEGGADHVALVMELSIESDLMVQYTQLDDETALNFSTSRAGGYFSWADSALVDGQPAPVKASWSNSKLVLSYPAGAVIKHDPVLGVQSLAAQSGSIIVQGSTPVFAIGLVLAAAVVGGAIILAVRRRKS